MALALKDHEKEIEITISRVEHPECKQINKKTNQGFFPEQIRR